MPASYQTGEFTSCDGDLQDVVGVYTSNGQSGFFFVRTVRVGLTRYAPALTWQQSTNLPATLPWTPRIPASSNCVTYSSQQLFGSATSSVSNFLRNFSPTVSMSHHFPPQASATSAPGAASTGAAAATGSNGGSTKATSSTATAAGSAKTNGAERWVMSTGLFALALLSVTVISM